MIGLSSTVCKFSTWWVSASSSALPRSTWAIASLVLVLRVLQQHASLVEEPQQMIVIVDDTGQHWTQNQYGSSGPILGVGQTNSHDFAACLESHLRSCSNFSCCRQLFWFLIENVASVPSLVISGKYCIGPFISPPHRPLRIRGTGGSDDANIAPRHLRLSPNCSISSRGRQFAFLCVQVR